MRRLAGHRLQVKWPTVTDIKLWETINTDVALTLEQVRGTVEKKMERMGHTVYQYGAERFGAPQEIKRLIQERRQLRRQWKKASEVEKLT